VMIFDSSPLQALHRASVLALLERAYEQVAIPGAVAAEMRASLAASGPSKVPDLDAYPWLRVHEVSDDEVARAGAIEPRSYRSTTRYRWGAGQINRPELEVLLLAARLGAKAVVEDRQALACAPTAGVEALGVAQLLCDLEERGFLDDAPARASAILATGYFSLDLRVLSHGHRHLVLGRP
jgi:predicted nucleic acid-binding protein